MLLTADADEFVTVAKFRAMRRLWARVEQACGLDPKPLRLHAETAWRMMTKRDPFVNILRTGMAAASAALRLVGRRAAIRESTRVYWA